jgi:hypothetical protein
MKREQLLKKISRWCRKKGATCVIDAKRGKGSHYVVTVNDRFAVVKYGELSPDYVRLVLKQLGIPRHEI